MKKRILSAVLALCMALVLCSCDLSDPNAGNVAVESGKTSQGVPILAPENWDDLLVVYYDTAADAGFAGTGMTCMLFVNFMNNGIGVDFPTYMIFESAEAANAYTELENTILTREFRDQTGAIGKNTYEVFGNVIVVSACDIYIAGMATMTMDMLITSYSEVPYYTCYGNLSAEDYAGLLENVCAGEAIALTPLS